VSKPIKPPEPSSYLSWEAGDERGRALAFSQTAAALKKVEPIMRTQGSSIFLNVAPGGVSVRDGFDRGDYESFRGGEALPGTPKESIAACENAYLNVGVVRNIIDLMADFAIQGIDLVHPNERIERFYKEWFRRVGGPERSERFVNYLYRAGNVVVKRQTAKLTARDEERIKKSIAEPEVEVEEPVKLLKREIPWRYTFLNPLSVELLAEELAPFLGRENFAFAIKISQNLSLKIRSPKGPIERDLVAKLPADILSLLKSGKRLIPLDPEKVRAFYYKRDDWKPWAFPMVHSILSDLNCLTKMKLADLAALDGAISCIRVWRLGNIEARIIPNEALIQRLAEMLTNNVGGGVMDLIWGPDIDLLETNTDVHHFLGQTKYEPVLTAIYAGLGVPPTLTGAATQSGFTNNFISLQTMTERLEYGRSILREFWEYEIRLVQRAMGFRFPATLVFDRMTLSDEASEKQLLINLADRDIISWESVVERFGETPEIEAVRLRREMRKREDGMLPEKASPFHDPEHEFGLQKIFSQGGTVTPSEVGLELEERASGEKTVMEQQQKHEKDVLGKTQEHNHEVLDKTHKHEKQSQKVDQETSKQEMDHDFKTQQLQLKHGVHPGQIEKHAIKHGVPGQGRPKNSNDKTKRKSKTVKPRTSAQFVQELAHAENLLASLNEMVAPVYLRSLGKQNLRQLTDTEGKDFEEFKFALLCQFQLGEEITQEKVKAAVSSDLFLPAHVQQLYRTTLSTYVQKNDRDPPVEVLRRFQASVFALYRGEYE